MDAPMVNSAAPISAYQTSPNNHLAGGGSSISAENPNQLPHQHQHHHQNPLLYKHHQIIGGLTNNNNANNSNAANDQQYLGQQIFHHMHYNLTPNPGGLVSHDAANHINNDNQASTIVVSNDNDDVNDSCGHSINVISINRSSNAPFSDHARSIGKIDNIDFSQHQPPQQQHRFDDSSSYFETQDQVGIVQHPSPTRLFVGLKNQDDADRLSDHLNNQQQQLNHQQQQQQHQQGHKFVVDANGLTKHYAGSSGRLSSESGRSSVDENCPAKQNFDYFPLSENELEQISVRDLNKLLQGQDREIISKVKAKRRTLKNRGYALKCRSRRIEIQTQLMNENKVLKIEINNLKQQLGDWHETKKELYFLRAEVARLRGKLQQICTEKAVLNCSTGQHATYYGGNLMQNLGGGEEVPNLMPLNFSAAFNARCLMPVSTSICLSSGSTNNSTNSDNNNYNTKSNVIVRDNNDSNLNVISDNNNNNSNITKIINHNNSNKPIESANNQWNE